MIKKVEFKKTKTPYKARLQIKIQSQPPKFTTLLEPF